MPFLEWNKTARYLYSRCNNLLSPSEQRIESLTEPGILCLQPFYFAEITTNGDVYTCCPGWIRFPIGNIKSNTIAEIWNSTRARYIRKKLYRGEWRTVCNPICPRISQYTYEGNLIPFDYLDKLDFLTPQLITEIRMKKEYLDSPPTVFNFSNSTICNLSCIMCDRHNQRDDPEVIQKTLPEILPYMPTAKRIVLAGMGDPLARPDTRRLLMEFKSQNPDFSFDLVTNGILLPRYWDRIKHQKFGSLLISVDASKKETYDKIRIGGSWDELMNSLDLVRENNEKFSSVTLNMTVMRHNYREIPEFIDLAESYGFNVSFQRIRGKHNQNFFEVKDVKAIDELKSILEKQQCKQRQITVFFEDLVEFMENREVLVEVSSDETDSLQNDDWDSEEEKTSETLVEERAKEEPVAADVMDPAESKVTEEPMEDQAMDEPLEDQVEEGPPDSIVTKLRKDAPLFHDDGTGQLITWHSNINLLYSLDGLLVSGMHTLETGSGYSTVVFLSKECFHTCIMPIKEEVERIKTYCNDTGISLDRAEFIIDESHNILPSMRKNEYDLIFIDGAHRFPFPIIDWFFCSLLLKENGLMIIDSTDIISCHILCKFMITDSHWEPVEVKEKYGIFKKLGGHDYPCDWQGQKFSMNKIQQDWSGYRDDS